jgi:hypothetical protein
VGSAPDLGCAADAAGGLSHRLLDPQHGIGGGRAWPDLLCGGCLATKLFGIHPDPNMQECFGTISASAYTLFQIMTLESWSMGLGIFSAIYHHYQLCCFEFFHRHHP